MKGSSNIVIRDARINDVELIAQNNFQLCFETEHGRQLDMEILKKGVTQGLKNVNLCRYFVAEVNNVVVGQLMITFEWSDWRNGICYWLQSVYVNKDFRGRGVFKTLYKHVQSIVDSDPSAVGMKLYVESDNEVAISTYQKLGMNDSGYLVYEYEKKKQ